MGSIPLSLLILVTVTTTATTTTTTTTTTPLMTMSGSVDTAEISNYQPTHRPLTLQDELNRMYVTLSKLSHHTQPDIRRTVCIVPIEREPVCGSDGQTYANRWLMECTALANRSRIAEITTGKCEAV
ncbi:uncharacterized protein LOC134223705 [Armigeres subalbatus]|uniref:uncharacterized protein LOC134223705 n=1 Tax=Armigeres subalbatus TaxID=124917 RepID=UPI002ED69573